MRLEPNPANPCFGCGGANSRGMRLVFEQDDENKLIRGHFRRCQTSSRPITNRVIHLTPQRNQFDFDDSGVAYLETAWPPT